MHADLHNGSSIFERVTTANVYDAAIRTPLEPAPRLSSRLGNHIEFKREDLQPVFSFKLRGAQNKLAVLPDAALRRGVICSSAGNHAQGLALAASRRSVRAVVVMPELTPQIKVAAVRALGAEIVLRGNSYDDAHAYATVLAQRDGLEFVHPFADPDVIAGQGTVALELAQQWRQPPDAIFVPIGGGGLISGIGSYMKIAHPRIRVIGVEPHEASAMHRSIEQGRIVTLERVGMFADGVAVRRVSPLTFRLAAEVVDAIELVSTDEICAAIKDIFEDNRTIVEPAGALAVAGLKRFVERTRCEDRHFITINSGSNINFDRLRHVSERAEIGEHREAIVAVEIPERLGSFREFCELIGRRNVTELNYRYSDPDAAQVFVGISLTDARVDTASFIKQVGRRGYAARDLSDNELAKVHIRHMVGGRVPTLRDEVIYRFEFPETPGALLAFLNAIGSRWNISLFHYRNHGSDYGRVLAGIQVPLPERQDLHNHLTRLGYAFWDETDNPAYRLFLA